MTAVSRCLLDCNRGVLSRCWHNWWPVRGWQRDRHEVRLLLTRWHLRRPLRLLQFLHPLCLHIQKVLLLLNVLPQTSYLLIFLLKLLDMPDAVGGDQRLAVLELLPDDLGGLLFMSPQGEVVGALNLELSVFLLAVVMIGNVVSISLGGLNCVSKGFLSRQHLVPSLWRSVAFIHLLLKGDELEGLRGYLSRVRDLLLAPSLPPRHV